MCGAALPEDRQLRFRGKRGQALDNVDGIWGHTRGRAEGGQNNLRPLAGTAGSTVSALCEAWSSETVLVHWCTIALKMLKSSKIVQDPPMPNSRFRTLAAFLACPCRISRSDLATAIFGTIQRLHWTGPPKSPMPKSRVCSLTSIELSVVSGNLRSNPSSGMITWGPLGVRCSQELHQRAKIN